MKKLLLFFVASAICLLPAISQTNTFPSSGSVGIGTLSPSDLLDIISGSSYIRKGKITFKPGYVGTPESGTDLYNWISSEYTQNTSWDLGLGGTPYNGGTPLLMIKESGKVGIGTITPNGMLHVLGGDAMTAGWNRTLLLDATYPVLGMKSGSTYGGVGFDNGSMFWWTNSSSADISAGSKAMNLNGAGQLSLYGSGGFSLGSLTGSNRISFSSSTFSFLNNSDVYANLAANSASFTGTVSIGTASPSGLLHLKETINDVVSLVFSTDFNSGVWRYTGTSSSNANQRMSYIGGAGTELLTILNDGYVGIGTSSAGSGRLTVRGAGTDGSGYAFEAANSNGNTRFIVRNDGQASFYGSDFSEKIRITSSGNLGIGTTTPSEMLTVNGTILTKKVKVTQAGWADFVFKKGYKLRSLEAVEAYIKQNKHLPGVPSESEVKRKGVDVGDTQAILLQKIEELTLYMIEQNKINKAQEKAIEDLKMELQKLKTKK